MQNAFFSPSAEFCSAIDMVDPATGRGGLYSGKTLEQFQAERPDTRIAPYHVAMQHDRQRRITPAREIDRETFDYLLEVLPPCKWTRRPGAEAFHVSERITHDIVTWCVRIGERFYRFDNTDKLTAEQAIDLVQAAQ